MSLFRVTFPSQTWLDHLVMVRNVIPPIPATKLTWQIGESIIVLYLDSDISGGR